MAIKSNEESFIIDTVGSTTGEQYKGKFTVKKWLSLADELVRDNKRRELLGPATGPVPPRIANMATVLSELYVRIVGEVPTWWEADGTALMDDEPAEEIYKKALEISNNAVKAVKKTGEQAKKELEKEEPVE